MDSIRPHILRQYYEVMYGSPQLKSRAFKDATFQEYYTLVKTIFPDIAPTAAAKLSNNAEYIEGAKDPRFLAKAPAAPSKKDPARMVSFRRRAILNLLDVPLDTEATGLLLDRIKTVEGWEKLTELKRLRKLILVLCGQTGEFAPEQPISLSELRVKTCGTSLLSALLLATNSQMVFVEHLDTPVVNLSLLRGHSQLRELWIFAGLAQGVKHLPDTPLETLFLSNVIMNQAFRQKLQSWQSTLTQLGLMNEESFGPQSLPELPALSRLKVPAYPEFRAEWIEFAVAHPQVRCEFPPVQEPYGKLPNITVFEIYHQVEILQVQRGRKVHFEVYGNLAGDLLHSDTLNNHTLADYLREEAVAAGKKVQISSSSDELIFESPRIEDCRWCIDRILDHFMPD